MAGSTAGEDLYWGDSLAAFVGLGIKEDVEDDWSAAHVGDPVSNDVPVDVERSNVAEAHVGSAAGGNAPCEGPSVAVVHRQRPQIHRFASHFPPEDQAEGAEVGSSVAVHPPFGSDVVPEV